MEINKNNEELEDRVGKCIFLRLADGAVIAASGIGFLSGSFLAGYGLIKKSDEMVKTGMYTMLASMGILMAYTVSKSSNEE